MTLINRLIKCNKRRLVKRVVKFIAISTLAGITGNILTTTETVIPAYVNDIYL